ncbi:hypothetical protein niasHT_012137 [Heterodera trifolii]|uniref:C2H2-type domain-containing protein n=1 Tax=Heterodera trifolii TaxID=157864 RepID=A0ABD2LAK0_9BILA
MRTVSVFQLRMCGRRPHKMSKPRNVQATNCPSHEMSKRTTEEAVNFGVEVDELHAVITSDNVEQQTLNEAELSTDFDSHTTQEIAGDAQIAVAQHQGCHRQNLKTGRAESKRQKIKETVLAEPCLKPTRSLSKVRRSATDEAFVAMSSNNALTEMIRREKKKLLGNVDVQDPLVFVIPATLREKRGEDIVLYDSRNVRQGEKDVVLIFGSVKTLDILRQCGTWHLDGTFKCAPAMWEQCFVIGASVHHRMCICMWCLLPGKQRRYYEEALNFLRGCTSPVVPGKDESIDRQVDAARSARHFIHKRHKRYILQDAAIMRILADTLLDISWFFTLLDISWLGQFVAWTIRGLDISWLGHFVAWTFRGLDILWVSGMASRNGQQEWHFVVAVQCRKCRVGVPYQAFEHHHLLALHQRKCRYVDDLGPCVSFVVDAFCDN